MVIKSKGVPRAYGKNQFKIINVLNINNFFFFFKKIFWDNSSIYGRIYIYIYIVIIIIIIIIKKEIGSPQCENWSQMKH
jgi:hypothetical protein